MKTSAKSSIRTYLSFAVKNQVAMENLTLVSLKDNFLTINLPNSSHNLRLSKKLSRGLGSEDFNYDFYCRRESEFFSHCQSGS